MQGKAETDGHDRIRTGDLRLDREICSATEVTCQPYGVAGRAASQDLSWLWLQTLGQFRFQHVMICEGWGHRNLTSFQKSTVTYSFENLFASAPCTPIQILEATPLIDCHSTIAYEGFHLRIPLAYVPSARRGTVNLSASIACPELRTLRWDFRLQVMSCYPCRKRPSCRKA